MTDIKVETNNDKLVKEVVLKPSDVFCGKGRGSHERRNANIFYRSLIQAKKDNYADSSMEVRVAVIGEIMSLIAAKGGWFIQPSPNGGELFVLTEEKVRKKISDDLRREERRLRASLKARIKAAVAQQRKSEETRKQTEPAIARREMAVLSDHDDQNKPPRQYNQQRSHGIYKLPRSLNLQKNAGTNLKFDIGQIVVDGIHSNSGDGKFLQKDEKTKKWYELSDEQAVHSISTALSNLKYLQLKKLGGDNFYV